MVLEIWLSFDLQQMDACSILDIISLTENGVY